MDVAEMPVTEYMHLWNQRFGAQWRLLKTFCLLFLESRITVKD